MDDSQAQLTELFRNLIKMAASDQKFADEEIQYLVERADAWGIANSVFDETLSDIASGDMNVSIPDADADREHLLKEMIRLMAVDGELAPIEKRMCASASIRMGFTTEQFGAIVDDLVQ